MGVWGIMGDIKYYTKNFTVQYRCASVPRLIIPGLCSLSIQSCSQVSDLAQPLDKSPLSLPHIPAEKAMTSCRQ